jgi:hypothetical protein
LTVNITGPRLIFRRGVLLSLVAAFLIVSGATLAGAQDLVHDDVRINQVAHFGGDALYCVDSNKVATTNYPEMIDDGGMRLLNSKGQELWFLPAEDILVAIAEALDTNSAVLAGEGAGTHGPVRLYVYSDDGINPVFVFSGYDEYGKPNAFTFIPCIPVGPSPERSGDGEELCAQVYIGPSGKVRPTTVKGAEIDPPPPPPSLPPVPCDECPRYVSQDLALEYAKRHNGDVSATGIIVCKKDAHLYV